MTHGHILQCSCDQCLNRGGGIPATMTPVHHSPGARTEFEIVRDRRRTRERNITRSSARHAALARRIAEDHQRKLQKSEENRRAYLKRKLEGAAS